MPKLIIPVGIPGCGKSTLFSAFNHTNMRCVETDGIREEMVKAGRLKSVNDMSCNSEVFDKFYERITDHLLDGFDVYADATNLQPFARGQLVDCADQAHAETLLLVFTNPSVAVTRNQKRERVVPADAMVRMLEQYEKALKAIPDEQYGRVIYIEGVA